MNPGTIVLLALSLAADPAGTAKPEKGTAGKAEKAAKPEKAAAGKAKKAPAKPAAPSAARFKLKPGASGAICLDCHGEFQEILKKPFVHTPVKSRECVGCHSPHASNHGKLLAAEPGKVCLTCHSGLLPENPRSTHKPIAEKGCPTCHDAHASANKFVVLKPLGELCGSCHKPVATAAAQAKYKHKPLEATGCVACHDPHASAKAESLLKDAVPGLCLGCHKTSAPIFTKAHLGYGVAKSDCTSCHDPHGSGKRGMLWNNVHPPVAKLMCGNCHEKPGAPRGFAPKQEAPTLCRSCHAQQLTAMLDKNRVHQPVLEGRACLTCHAPHASRDKGLLKGRIAAVCGSCHAETIRRGDRAAEKHAPVAEGQCASCHDPHSSAGPMLFVNSDRIELCAQCHDWTKHSTHPIGEKRVDPRNKNLRVECLSCHRAHGTPYPKLIPYAKQSELCTKCHETYTR